METIKPRLERRIKSQVQEEQRIVTIVKKRLKFFIEDVKVVPTKYRTRTESIVLITSNTSSKRFIDLVQTVLEQENVRFEIVEQSVDITNSERRFLSVAVI